MANPVRLPQINPGLLAQMAQAKGQAASAPFRVAGETAQQISKILREKKQKEVELDFKTKIETMKLTMNAATERKKMNAKAAQDVAENTLNDKKFIAQREDAKIRQDINQRKQAESEKQNRLKAIEQQSELSKIESRNITLLSNQRKNIMENLDIYKNTEESKKKRNDAKEQYNKNAEEFNRLSKPLRDKGVQIPLLELIPEDMPESKKGGFIAGMKKALNAVFSTIGGGVIPSGTKEVKKEKDISKRFKIRG